MLSRLQSCFLLHSSLCKLVNPKNLADKPCRNTNSTRIKVSGWITCCIYRATTKKIPIKGGRSCCSFRVWAFHGAKDPVVPVSESQRMIDLLRKHGVPDVKFTIYPEAKHNSWTQAYKDPELYKWLLEHKRNR